MAWTMRWSPMREVETHKNENDMVAARLAARLGLQRVFAIDDHTGDNMYVADEAAYGKTVQEAWNAASAAAAPMRKQETTSPTAATCWRCTATSTVPTSCARADSDFGAAMRDPSPQHYGQLYVAGWETRNLRMVANIRAAFRERPGTRVLSIVGASHKPWFDSLLGQMQGVDVVDAEKLLQE